MLNYFQSTTYQIQRLLPVLLIIVISSIKGYSQCPPAPPESPGDTYSDGPSTYILLEASDVQGPYQYNWYSDKSGGTPLLNDNSETMFYTTGLVTKTDTFYVSRVSSSCPTGSQESSRVPVIAIIDPALYPDNSNHAAFGDQEWYVYCYNDTSYSVYSGYYIDTDFNIASAIKWDSLESPSSKTQKTPGYQGGKIQTDFHSIIYKKQNFPDGIYRIDIENHDDFCELWIDGKRIFKHKSFGHPHPDTWTGPLGPTSTIEFRWLDFEEASIGKVTITPISKPVNLKAGIMPDDKTACYNKPIGILTPGKSIAAYKDTYVDFSSATQNFGNSSLIANVGPKKYIYLAFDISAIGTDIDNADLVLTTKKLSVIPNSYISLHGVSDTTWKEFEMNWDTQPAIGQYIDSMVISDSIVEDYKWNITDYLKSEIAAGRKRTSVVLKINHIPYLSETSFYSRESSFKPHILINDSKSACSFKTFQWQGQPECTGTFTDIPQATNKTYDPGVVTQKICYRLKVEDLCNNSSISDTLEINISNPPAPTLSDVNICKNSQAVITASGNTESFNWYNLSTGGTLQFSGKVFTTPSLSKDTSYFVAGVDGICVGSDRTEVKVKQLPESIAGTLTADNNVICADIPNVVNLQLNGYSGSILSYLASNDNFIKNSSVISSTTNEITVTNLTESNYYKAIVKNGICAADTTEAYMVKANYTEPGKLSISELNIDKGTLSLNGYEGKIVRWESSADEFKTFDSIPNSSAELSFTNTSPLYFRTVVQAESCPEEKSEYLKVGLMNLYTSFSPNKDGINDNWIIDNIENSSTNTVSIFNRWGELVFEMQNYNNTDRVWDGTSNKGLSMGSNELPDGTYFYIINLNEEKPVSGYIIIKR